MLSSGKNPFKLAKIKRQLENDQINRLVAQERVKNKPGGFLSQDKQGMLNLALAVSRKDATVEIGSKRYSIRYDNHWPDTVFVNPTDGRFVPCGYFNTKRLKDILEAEGAIGYE